MAVTMPAREQPFRQLVALLPHLALTEQGLPDYAASDAAVLVQIAEACELLQRVISLGVGAVGQLLAHSSVDVETGELGQEAVEAVGWLVSEVCDGSAAFMALAARCRHATADFTGARDAKAA